ncbi:DUF3489 domain-containing protein [Plastoroseomonas arctica]|uniref:DUF3489 domain-containing protein n=1 Tax=Plastoroseomonas arctica TaxID=1509237 RepID=A0AAF1JWA6_9PROT|nr:DUF3489 domain-containing protein [Plastoroseomonas arctica]MBR0654602.1 DUF3489 domain-containing protein [Plastoroseomonas arctica]
MSSITMNLSNAQLQVLTAGAERPNRLLLPLPATIPLRGGACRSLLAALLKLHFVEEIQAEDARNAWRTDAAGKDIGLRLTAAGLAAVGAPAEAPACQATDLGKAAAVDPQIDAIATVEDAAGKAHNGGFADPESGATGPRRPTGKLGAALQAIAAEKGATLTELTALTNWLPHTTRAAVTGLRQRGFPIALIQVDGRKAYRLTAAG